MTLSDLRYSSQESQDLVTDHCLERLMVQKTDSTERERWMGWEGERASRFLGSRSRVCTSEEKSGLRTHQHHIQRVKKESQYLAPVLGIWIRMFLGLLDPDPDPLIRGMDPAPDSSLFS
jgi:hypothetical protein